MALMSHVTTFEDDKPIHRLLINLGVEVSNQKINIPCTFPVFLLLALIVIIINPKCGHQMTTISYKSMGFMEFEYRKTMSFLLPSKTRSSKTILDRSRIEKPEWKAPRLLLVA